MYLLSEEQMQTFATQMDATTTDEEIDQFIDENKIWEVLGPATKDIEETRDRIRLLYSQMKSSSLKITFKKSLPK